MAAHLTPADQLVLHALRCIGFTSVERISTATGVPPYDVESELIDLAVLGLVTHMPGEFSGWGLTAQGKIRDAELIAAELITSGAHRVVATAYDTFLTLNPVLLEICTAWQLRPRTIADGHVADQRDPQYDARVLKRLVDLDQRAATVCHQLSTALARFSPYRSRLAAALARAQKGESAYVTDDLESYHMIWFQLHEDLLTTMGQTRH